MLRVTSYVLDMAHTKAQKAVKGNRDSQPKRRGVKIFGGQKAIAGNILPPFSKVSFKCFDSFPTVLESTNLTSFVINIGPPLKKSRTVFALTEGCSGK